MSGYRMIRKQLLQEPQDIRQRESDTLRGHSLYVSYDAGQTFEKLMQPENVMIHDSKMNGLVASRYDYDGTYLYVTMNVTGRWNYVVDLGYSCDSGM